MKKFIAVIGARPQFIKHFPLDQAAKGKVILKTIHTGQHYDEEMSQVFFDELGMSQPDFYLHTGGGNHGAQTGKMLKEIEEILIQEQPNAMIVYGDTNSTLAGALSAAKLHIPVVHIEAGIRSYNKKLPEEVNRILTDHVAEMFFVPTDKATECLNKEGITENIYNFGDIMKDVMDHVVKKDMLDKTPSEITEPYYYATIHRPYNTDEKARLEELLQVLNGLKNKVVFSIHPRTDAKMTEFNLSRDNYNNILFIKPQGYIKNLTFIKNSELVITDSGGIQKEAYWLKRKCITLRSETEWAETLENGWNQLCYENLESLNDMIEKPLGDYVPLYAIENTSEKIIDLLSQKY